MKYLVNAREMKAIDSSSIDKIGIPSAVLMERAALSVAEEVDQACGRSARVLVISGVGNNGADGIAAARILSQMGHAVRLAILGSEERATDEWLLQYNIASNLDLYICHQSQILEYINRREYDVIVDALFGIGLVREVVGEYAECIDAVNRQNVCVVAVDIPSGLSADSGAVLGAAVRADITVTFGSCKLGMVLLHGPEYCGKIVVKDIGFPDKAYDMVRPGAFTYEKEDLKSLPVRPAYSNKGTFGRVLVIAGSKNMSGAAYFSALAAYRMGAGLVRILTVEENREILQSILPEAILTTYRADEFTVEAIREACAWATVIVVGPGLGTDDYVRSMLNYIFQYTEVPCVIDADALNVIARYPSMLEVLTERCILTPHPGEMARLTGKDIRSITADLPGCVREFVKAWGCVCVLKDARTVVGRPEGVFYINMAGNSGMATGGSGDVLTGVIAGLLAQGMPEFSAASMGVFLHSLAGDLAAERLGERAVMASSIIDALPEVTRG